MSGDLVVVELADGPVVGVDLNGDPVTAATPVVVGPPGPAGGTEQVTAATTLSGHRAIVLTPAGAGYADPGNPAHAWAAVAITLGAATTGDPVTVRSAGLILEPSWAFTPGLPVFIGPAGTLTQTPPTTGWQRAVGVATTPTSLWLDFTPPITLSS